MPAAAGLVIHGLAISTPLRDLVAALDLSLAPPGRVALVGPNGSGKSTLLEVVLSRARGLRSAPHLTVHGQVHVGRGTRIGHLPQTPPQWAMDRTVSQYADHCARERAGALTAFLRACDLLAGAPEDAALLAAHAATQERVEALDAWNVREERDLLLEDLVGGGALLDRPLRSVSGGEATRVALAGMLLEHPNVLLLDEPNNNLDAAGLDYLARWIRDSGAAVLMASHDRDLLDLLATQIVELGGEDGVVRVYGGNYTSYREQRAEAFAAALRQYEEAMRRRHRLLEDAARLGMMGQRFQGRSSSDYFRARGKKVARRATVQIARVGRELDMIDEPVAPRRPRLVIPAVQIRDDLLVALRDVCLRHADAAPVLDGVSLAVHGGERIGVVGANGAGKTTLLRLLDGAVLPSHGTVVRAGGVRMARLAQDPPFAPERQPVLDWARTLVAVDEERVRDLLGKVLVGDVTHRSMGRLSAGERRRVELALLFTARPDLVMLDEPGNHLDLPSVEMLEEALSEYRGALIIVSHDRRLLAAADLHRMLHLDGRGGVDDVVGWE